MPENSPRGDPLKSVDSPFGVCDTLKMTAEELEFAVFCIENTAERTGLKGEEIYRLLTEQSGILDEYLIPSYDVLHTQGKEYIVDDIVAYMREKRLL